MVPPRILRPYMNLKYPVGPALTDIDRDRKNTIVKKVIDEELGEYEIIRPPNCWANKIVIQGDTTFVLCEGSFPTLVVGASIFGGLVHKNEC